MNACCCPTLRIPILDNMGFTSFNPFANRTCSVTEAATGIVMYVSVFLIIHQVVHNAALNNKRLSLAGQPFVVTAMQSFRRLGR